MRVLSLLWLATAVLSCAQGRPEGHAADAYLITHVNVVSLDGEEVLADRSVLVADGKIADIFDARSRPSSNGAVVVDGAGRYLAPGLVDAHVHVGLRSDLERYVAHGVTAVREMWGLPRSLRWRDAIEAGTIAGPHMVVSSTYFWLNGPADTMHLEPTDPATAREQVRQVKAEGYDLVKVVGLANMETLDALVDEARRLNLPVSGHYPDRSVALEKMLAVGMWSFEHLDEFSSIAFPGGADEARMREVARLLRDEDIGLTTILTPTSAIWRSTARERTTTRPRRGSRS